MLGVGGDEDRLALRELDFRALYLEHARAFEDDVDLVVLVRLLAVGLGSDEHVDADLETGRRVDDLVATALGEASAGARDVEEVLRAEAQTGAVLNSGMISEP